MGQFCRYLGDPPPGYTRVEQAFSCGDFVCFRSRTTRGRPPAMRRRESRPGRRPSASAPPACSPASGPTPKRRPGLRSVCPLLVHCNPGKVTLDCPPKHAARVAPFVCYSASCCWQVIIKSEITVVSRELPAEFLLLCFCNTPQDWRSRRSYSI